MPPPSTKSSKKALNMSVNQSSMKKSVMGGSRFGRSVISSRTALSSSSKKTLAEADKRQVRAPVQVFDETGQDVTPIPLLAGIEGGKKGSNIMGDSSGGTPTDLMSSVSIYQTGTVSTYGGGPFTRSVFSTSQSEKSSESIGDDMAEPAADLSSAWADVRTQREEQVKEDLTEAELDKQVTINLTETDTIWLLDMPGVSISAESDDALAIKERNEKYKALLKSRVGNDLYVERAMNTFNDPPKLKSVQTDKIGHSDAGVSASNWDMFDTYEAIRLKAEKEKQDEEEALLMAPAASQEKKDGEEETAETPGQRDDTKPGTRAGMESRGTMASAAESDKDSMFVSTKESSASSAEGQAELDAKILKSESLRKNLFIMERVVNCNTYQPKLALYRGFDVIPDIDKVKVEDADEPAAPKQAQIAVTDMGPNLDRLWSYQSLLLKGRNVSCMTWNKVNPDLLACGYGQFEFTGQKAGTICCWSLKNPEFPERVFTSKAGATAMDFSLTNPNLLAVGFYDGTVAIYNVRQPVDEVMLDSFDTQGKHTGPVWHLKWIERERGSGDERAEILVSASTDGRITQWSIRKGFECNDLMKLKRVPVKHSSLRGKEKKMDALIQRYAGGFCFDFSPVESNIYLAGTEEGHVHKCSCSYNEQFLDSYIGHTGPVYQVSWSPFVPGVFLSCSADWTVILWHEDRQSPVISFHSSTKSVHGICWSPRSSTVFACVNEGAVEVWDLNMSTLDPIIVTSPVTGAKLSTVAFAKNSDSLLVGDSAGQVTVYEMRCMPDPPTDQDEALRSIIQSSLASQLQNAPR